ncbi:uncharacterized protein LOC128302750 [Anopheles moucheti]|uniref:uncharacterized protein LOC128302750 n=1 Tax=Anopheles moucheti TaxID=186751 RepID=UPI0022F081B8|nr:uncharacterized protein LOC128302750 [Anopheles moucheti]
MVFQCTTKMKELIHLWIVSVCISSGVVAAYEEYNIEAFSIVQRVFDRLEQDATQLHDVLCVNCDDKVFEDVVIRLQQVRPYVTMRRFTLLAGTRVMPSGMHRIPTLVLQSCTPASYCHWGESFLFSNPHKYSIFIQFFHGLSIAQRIHHANELASGGIMQILQIVAPSDSYSKCSVYITGALAQKVIKVSNNSEMETQLFDGTLTNFRNFVYEVGLVPMFVHLYTKKNTFQHLEINAFLTILKKQGAKYRFHRETNLNHLLTKMLSGKMHVLLNSVEMSGTYFEFAYWKDIQEYCIILPRRYERMHLQLLLTPFKWQIWMVIVLILVGVQVVSLIFPDRVPRSLILKCFFGGGEREHNLTTGSRLIVCAICILIFLFTETYQAILLSLMSADPFVKNPETIDEFIEQNHTLLILKGTKENLPSTLRNLANEVDKMELNMTIRNASIASCELAHFLNKNPFDWELPSKPDLIVVKPHLYQRLKHIVFSRTCPAVREYQRYMDIMFEVGLYHRDHMKWFPKRVLRRREKSFNDLIVLTDDLIPVWELLGTGLSVALACFVAEHVVFRLYYIIRMIKRIKLG